MKEHDFELRFRLPRGVNPEDLAERLCDDGCRDALVGRAHDDEIALQFCRAAACSGEAMRSALQDVIRVEPKAMLLVSR